MIVSIVEQHAEEAAFLWTQRDRAVLSPSYTLRDLARLDERVEAHLDGLRVAGQAGWEICKQAVEAEEAGALFALASLAFASNDRQKVEASLSLGCSKADLQRELISALGWLPFERIKPTISTLVKTPDPKVRRIGIAGFAVHRRDPGPVLTDALYDSDDRLRARAIVAAAELGRKDLAGSIRSPGTEVEEDNQFAAAWALTRFGWTNEVLKKIAVGQGPRALRALEMALRSMELGTAKTWCSALLEQRVYLRLGVIGLGIIGDPESVEQLIVLMKKTDTARLAGQAFSMITGVDFQQEGLIGTVPEEFAAQPSDDADSEVVDIHPDEGLSWPSATNTEAWWFKRGRDFLRGVRYFQGGEITTESLRRSLANQTQHRRASAAIELAVRHPTEPIIEVRQRGDYQLKSAGY